MFTAFLLHERQGVVVIPDPTPYRLALPAPRLTREEWLYTAIDRLEPLFTEAAYAMPSLKVSVGFPSKRGLSTKNRVIGECWHKDGIRQDSAHVFISPVLSDPVQVLGVVIHEMLHAILPPNTGHNKTFATACLKLGLAGKPTATIPGEALIGRLNAILAELPAYPHNAFDASLLKKKQSTRLRLYQCDCPVKVRVASDEFDATCNVCEGQFQVQQKDGE